MGLNGITRTSSPASTAPAAAADEPAAAPAEDRAPATSAPADGFDLFDPASSVAKLAQLGIGLFSQLAQSAPSQAVTPGTTPPPTPAGTYDVGAMSAADVTKLAASKSPVDRDLAATITRAKKAYADRLSAGARILVNTSPANGNKPVLTLIPPGFDYSKPATVQTHYHGWNSTVAEAKGHSAGLSFRMQDVQAADPQHVFVLPECANAKDGAFHTDWSNVKSEAQTTDDALAAAGIGTVGSRVVSAHSGGGAALASAIDQHSDGSGLKADRLELLDCLYGSQAQVEKWAATANGKACPDVTYYHGTNDAKADAKLPAAFGARYHRVNVSTPHPVPTGVGPNGKPVPRFNADPHNTTVGQYT